MEFYWEDGFEIAVRIEDGQVVVSANKAGLRSLARQLTALAESEPGAHIHLDQYNSLEDGSVELVIERID